MKIEYALRNNLKLIIMASVLVVGFVVSLLIVDFALAKNNRPVPQAASGEKVLSIYDRGEERVIITRAQTLRQALKSADIPFNIGWDAVEPGLDEKLVAAKYNVNIYRAKPVTVVDGELRKRITTAKQTPELIAKAADIKLYEEDNVEIELASDHLVDAVDTVMHIDRATPMKLNLYGKQSDIRTQAKTVGELLKEKSIELGADDSLSVDKSTPITKDMLVELWRNGTQTVTVEEEIDFPVEKINDANRPSDFKEVKTPGEKGKKNVTYEIEMQNGKEISRKEIASVVTAEPKKQVETVGTKPTTVPYTGGGSKSEWLAASGIAKEDWGYAEWLVQKESGWNPNAVNRSSGACGLGQQLPCGKWAGQWNNPVDSLKGMNGYVKARYGGWAGAVAHSKSRGWY